MRLRWHLLILGAIVVATILFLPTPFFLSVLVAAAEGLLYGLYILAPSKAGRRIEDKHRRRLGR